MNCRDDRVMTPHQIRLLDALAPHLPPAVIVTDREAIAPWETDWRGRWHGHAAVLFAPDTVAQVQSHLFAHQYEGLIRKARLGGRGAPRGR